MTPELDTITAAIKTAHTEATSGRSAWEAHADRCGRLLVDAKAQVKAEGHRWLPWLRENLPELGERTARRYMARLRPKPADRTRVSVSKKSADRQRSAFELQELRDYYGLSRRDTIDAAIKYFYNELLARRCEKTGKVA